MWLVAGLGNPGSAYRGNRHNVGVMALEAFVAANASIGLAWRKRFQGEALEFTCHGQKILALKPMTYMNMSGVSLQEAAAFYKIPLAAVAVLHDDLDLAFGRIELKRGGGHGGHNGLKSIDAHLGQEYWRIRIGIGHPLKGVAGVPKETKQQIVSNHVLSNFSKDEGRELPAIIDAAVAACTNLLSEKQSTHAG